MAWVLGVIGGSGLYDIEGLEDARWTRIESPFGEPSDEALTGAMGAVRLVFLPRHGRGHRLPPTHVNARANIDALKRAGCTDVVSISAVGSLRESLAPGDFVVVDQFIDRTFAREKSFFGQWPRGARVDGRSHQSPSSPISPGKPPAPRASRISRGRHLPRHGGTAVLDARPRANALPLAGAASVIGMTNMPEAKLAREAELPYASVAMVTDYDCWREEAAPVEVGHIQAVLAANADKARALVAALAHSLPPARAPSPIDTCLDGALITARSAWAPAMVEQLSAVAGRVLAARGGG